MKVSVWLKRSALFTGAVRRCVSRLQRKLGRREEYDKALPAASSQSFCCSGAPRAPASVAKCTGSTSGSVTSASSSSAGGAAALARIRREIEKQRRSIQESLRGYLRRLSEGGTVQDELVTIRGERFVIPVKVEQKRRVQGVVHGASSSGQTVFIEPLETIEQNNELVRLLEEELSEIHRILLEMTQRIGAKSEEILAAVDVLGELELQFAKARFAEDYNCAAVTLSGQQDSCGDGRPRPSGASEARLLLHNARHPLLERNLKAKGISKIGRAHV